MRRTTPPSGSTLSSPWPAAPRRSRSPSAAWRRSAGEGRGVAADRAHRAIRPGGREPGSAILSTPAMRQHDRAAADRRGQHRVVARERGELVRRDRGRSCGSARAGAAATGDPGSGITTSRPMAAGVPAAMRSNSAASSVRGHGHCPWAARLGSSTSTITTGPDARRAGEARWQTSNQDRRSVSRPGTYGIAHTAARTTTSRKPTSRPLRSGETRPAPGSAREAGGTRDRSPYRPTPPRPARRGRRA